MDAFFSSFPPVSQLYLIYEMSARGKQCLIEQQTSLNSVGTDAVIKVSRLLDECKAQFQEVSNSNLSGIGPEPWRVRQYLLRKIHSEFIVRLCLDPGN